MATGTATTVTCPGYTNQAFVNDQDGKKNLDTCSLVIANGSQKSQESHPEPPASPTNEATVPGLPDSTSSSNISKESFLRVTIHSSSGSSSDSQLGTGTTSQSDLAVDFTGPSHDGGTSSTGEPATLFSNGFIRLERHLFPDRSCRAKQFVKNPIYIEEPGPDEVTIKNNSVSSGLRENFDGADLKDGVACSRKKCLSVCIPITLVFVFCAAVALLVTFWTVPDFQRLFLTEANVQMRVSDKFQPSMVNVSSPESVEYGNFFCYHLTQTIIKGMEVEAADNCTVKNLRNGSIIVDAQVNVLTNQNLTADDFLHALKKAARADGDYIMLGIIKVFNNSLDVTSVYTVEQPGEVPERKVPAEFDCSVGGAHFKPFPYTHPAYCGHFQLCKDGDGIPLLCEEGLEFADDSGTTHTPCRYQSNTTYCGRKRSEDATSSTPSTTAATTSSSTTTTATDSTKSTNATPTVTAEATTTDICSLIHKSILSNDSSLYTCTLEWTFKPRNDTYPNNCGHYLECWNGVGLLRKCANGTHFAYGTEPRMACHNTWDDATFCRQMTLAETCRKLGQDS